MKANEKQVGGNHYKSKAIQPWEVIERNGMGFFDGNALKYLMRHKEKGGVEDLKKAIHYLEKMIEMQQAKTGFGEQWKDKAANVWKPYDNKDDHK